MLKKRLIGVLTVKNNLVVQSIGYKKYLPIGNPRIVVENLDRWGVDEIICLSIDSSKNDYGPNYELIKSITSKAISTPLTYGGGIKNPDEAAQVIKFGVERVVIDNAFHGDINKIIKVSEKIGSQALIISLPISIKNKTTKIYNHKNKKLKDLSTAMFDFFKENHCSEILLIDKENEGILDGFNANILDFFPIKNPKKIIFGGLNNIEKLRYFFKHKEVDAIAIGNSLNYKEHSVQKIKEDIKLDFLRERFYREN